MSTGAVGSPAPWRRIPGRHPTRAWNRRGTLPAPLGVRLAVVAAIVLIVPFGFGIARYPLVTLGAAIGLAGIAYGLTSLTGALFAFAFASAVVPAIGTPPQVVIRALALLITVSWLMPWILRRDSKVRGLLRTAPLVGSALGLFLVWSLLSALWAPSVADVTYAVPRYASVMAFVAIAVTALRSTRDLRPYLAAVCFGEVGAALGAMALGVTADGGRLSSATTDANFLAMGFIAGGILAAGLVLTSRRSLTAVVFTGSAGICILGLLLTESRGGILGATCALLAWVVLGGRRRPAIAAAVVVLAVVGSGYVLFLAPAATSQRLASIVSSTSASDEGTGRTDIWRVGWETFKAHPIGGVGIGNYTVVTPKFVPAAGLVRRSDLIIVDTKVAHNIYLNVLVETGVVGFALFFGAIAGCLWHLLRAARRAEALGDDRLGGLLRATLAASIGVLGADFFISSQYSHILWLLIATGPAASAILASRDRHPARTDPPEPAAATVPAV